MHVQWNNASCTPIVRCSSYNMRLGGLVLCREQTLSSCWLMMRLENSTRQIRFPLDAGSRRTFCGANETRLTSPECHSVATKRRARRRGFFSDERTFLATTPGRGPLGREVSQEDFGKTELHKAWQAKGKRRSAEREGNRVTTPTRTWRLPGGNLSIRIRRRYMATRLHSPAFVPSLIACFASSPGKMRRTAV